MWDGRRGLRLPHRNGAKWIVSRIVALQRAHNDHSKQTVAYWVLLLVAAKKIAIENSLLSKLPHDNMPRGHFCRQKIIKKEISQFDGHQQ
jgi:hypothetical protein